MASYFCWKLHGACTVTFPLLSPGAAAVCGGGSRGRGDDNTADRRRLGAGRPAHRPLRLHLLVVTTTSRQMRVILDSMVVRRIVV